MATSVRGGSDEVYEFVCQPCERGNQYEEGVGYCVDCSEYMCSTCLICHKKSLASCGHKLLDKTSIPHGIQRQPPPTPPKPTKQTTLPIHSKPTKPTAQQGSFTQKCKSHNDEFTKLYCNDHDDLVCTVCLVKDHKQCKDVTYIPDVSGNIKQSTELKHNFTELKRMHALLGFEHNRMIYNKTSIEEIHKSAIDGLIKFKEDMLQAIEQVYAAVEQDLNAMRDEQKAGLDSWLERYNVIQADVKKLLSNVESNMNNGNYNQLFVDIKLAKAEMSSLKEKTQRLSDDNHVTQIKFEGNTDILDTLKFSKGFGKILKRSSPANVSAELLHEITVKSDKDTDDCRINAALVLPDSDLALADSRNNSVKIIDVRKKTVKNQIFLESDPIAIALVEDDQLAVALPRVRKIQFLQISKNELTMIRSISINGMCVGIEYHDKKLITLSSFVDAPGKVIIMDMNGRIVTQMDRDCLDRFFFTQPRCLTLSADKSALYITEERNKRVILVNLNGEQIAEYQPTVAWEIRNAPGITTDKDGVVYTSHGDTHAIYQLSHDCTRPKKLLSVDDGLARLPFAITLDQHRDVLYVGSVSTQPEVKNKISAFQLKYNWV